MHKSRSILIYGAQFLADSNRCLDGGAYARLAFQIFRDHGLKVVGVPTDENGMQADALEVRIRAEGLASLVAERRQQGERKAA